MICVEDVPRLDIKQLKGLPHWPGIRKAKRVVLSLANGATARRVEIALTVDATALGERWWFQCLCGSRRKFLYLRDGHLRCRRCQQLLYIQQRLPQTRWREETGRPLLKAARNHQSPVPVTYSR